MTHRWLRIYPAPSGQWSGLVFDDGAEIARLAGSASPGEIMDTAGATWPGIEVELSEEAKAFWAAGAQHPNTDPSLAPTCSIYQGIKA